MHMKNMNYILVAVIALTLTTGGCGRKEKEGGISTSGTTSGSVVDPTVLAGRAGDPIGGTDSPTLKELDATPLEEQIRQVQLSTCVLLGSAVGIAGSFVIEKYADRIASYAGYLSTIPERMRLLRNGEVGTVVVDGATTGSILRHKDKVLKEFDAQAYATARQSYAEALSAKVARIQAAYPKMSAEEALARVSNRWKNRELGQRLAEVEQNYLKTKISTKLQQKAYRGILWGVKGLRIASLAGIGWVLYNVVAHAEEIPQDIVTAEQKRESYEEALRNHEHDSQNIFWQNEVIRTGREFWPEFIEVIELQVGATKAQIKEISSHQDSAEKTEALSDLNAQLSEQENDLAHFQAQYNVISAEGSVEKVIQIMKENMDKIKKLSSQK